MMMMMMMLVMSLSHSAAVAAAWLSVLLGLAGGSSDWLLAAQLALSVPEPEKAAKRGLPEPSERCLHQ